MRNRIIPHTGQAIIFNQLQVQLFTRSLLVYCLTTLQLTVLFLLLQWHECHKKQSRNGIDRVSDSILPF